MQQEIKALFEQADCLVISTGAGMGKDSGLPVFRNENGLWGQIEENEGRSIFEISNPAYLDENPVKAWKFYAMRMKMFAEHQPHEGFYMLKEWIQKYQLNYFVLTSNIDSYFQRAGYDPMKIRELHGSMNYLQCVKKSCPEIWKNEVDYDEILNNPSLEILPKSQCNSEYLARPNVYMFRDWTYVFSRSNEQKARYQTFLEENQGKKTIVIEIGSGRHVQSIRQKSRQLIKSHQATLIRINPNDSKVKEGHISIAKGGLEALTELNQIL